MKTLCSLLLVVCTVIGTISCSDENSRPQRTFVLIAGSWQGAWAWKDVKRQLELSGNNVVVVELPTHGTDDTPPQNVSMDVYRDKVIEKITNVRGKVILVGHSMAGVVISAVSEKIPEKIDRLIYIGAILPGDGQSLLDLASTDTEALLGPSIITSEDNLLLDVIRDNITTIFCQDCTEDLKKLVLDNFRLEPSIPFGDRIRLSDDRFGKIKKHFIYTEFDHAVGPMLQKRMVEATANVTTHSLPSGHSPHLSKPDDLAFLLYEIAFW